MYIKMATKEFRCQFSVASILLYFNHSFFLWNNFSCYFFQHARYRLLPNYGWINICTFAAIDSKSIAIVILEGNAWGLMMRSGLMPVFAENGMSMSGHNCEQTPFCPCLLLNLSPIIGFLTRRRRIFAWKKRC